MKKKGGSPACLSHPLYPFTINHVSSVSSSVQYPSMIDTPERHRLPYSMIDSWGRLLVLWPTGLTAVNFTASNYTNDAVEAFDAGMKAKKERKFSKYKGVTPSYRVNGLFYTVIPIHPL